MTHAARYWLLFIGMLSGLAGCTRDGTTTAPPAPPAGPAWFADEAAERGIDFTWISGHRERFYSPESIGGGAALFDMDGDGDLDAYLVQAGRITESPSTYPPNRLFENAGDGTFTDVTYGSGAEGRGYGMGVACGDYDGDGDVDLYVTNVGPNLLLRNEGGGRFADVTDIAGVGHPDWGSSCAFLDFDRDGDLDLFVLNYINWSVETEFNCYNSFGGLDYCLPANYDAPGRYVLYRNEGDGTFTDATDAAGMQDGIGTGLGVIAGDFNGDRWPDLFVANDGMPDQLWFNKRDGRFQELGGPFGAALDMEGKAKAGMGVAAADIDNDRDLDLIVCNLRLEADSLFINEGTHFRDGTIRAGLGASSRQFTRFGVGLVDFDNDGHLDLYEANGRVFQESDTYRVDDVYAEPNHLYRGGSGPRFELVHPRGGTADPLMHTSRGAAFGDVDSDGGIDVLVVNRDGPAYLLMNRVPQRGHWMLLKVVDRDGRDAIGASVEIDLGERTLRRDVRPAYSYMCSNDPRVHVGLGADATPRTVTVRWPDGTDSVFEGVGFDQVTTLRR